MSWPLCPQVIAGFALPLASWPSWTQTSPEPDEVVILEVMCEELDRPWWASYRELLARELKQKELVVRAIPIETL